MSDDQRQGEKASAGDGEEEQGQVDFHKTRTEGERSGTSTRAPLTSGLREQIAKTVAPFSCPANQQRSQALQLRRTQTSSDQALENDKITSLTNKMKTATNSKTNHNDKSVLKSKTNSQPAESYIESGASCPASGLLPVTQKPETSLSNSGSRVNNPVFHAPNCLNKAHIPGKRGRQEGTPEPEAGDDVTSKPPKKTPTSTEAAAVQNAFPPDIYLT